MIGLINPEHQKIMYPATCNPGKFLFGGIGSIIIIRVVGRKHKTYPDSKNKYVNNNKRKAPSYFCKCN